MANKSLAITLLQLIALAIPPIAVLIQMLRESENLEWQTRKFSFGLAIMSIGAFLSAGAVTILYFVRQFELGILLQSGLILTIVGLLPFVLFTGVLYREHKARFK